ncbi:uncharacterized protein BO80DRAFT_259618 [Aspergillus ibericus CBS 121593]|uniref:Uncharacterized protein n=1 Tax=Aspergillus ibericus CBS 121593 TaxID=1448316 RepID=A0A395GKP9_9EURO|nr:hypothetical protein BO80DRAFT_259618 [Aspergillus ibericus CBS 121593]RAK95628.1 hypothetical protein BO80DRAFT_259618 [Aspergillus ibericus CBS 121593]
MGLWTVDPNLPPEGRLVGTGVLHRRSCQEALLRFFPQLVSGFTADYTMCHSQSQLERDRTSLRLVQALQTAEGHGTIATFPSLEHSLRLYTQLCCLFLPRCIGRVACLRDSTLSMVPPGMPGIAVRLLTLGHCAVSPALPHQFDHFAKLACLKTLRLAPPLYCVVAVEGKWAVLVEKDTVMLIGLVGETDRRRMKRDRIPTFRLVPLRRRRWAEGACTMPVRVWWED